MLRHSEVENSSRKPSEQVILNSSLEILIQFRTKSGLNKTEVRLLNIMSQNKLEERRKERKKKEERKNLRDFQET